MIKILIADDNSASLYMLERLLKGHGFEVISAENGVDALEKARINPPHLIVTDILMPEMDGYALCREWKADASLMHIPLIFYTATYTDPKDELFALSLGADWFLIKPQEPDVLINIIKKVLEEKSPEKRPAPKPLGEDIEFFRQYNEVLFKKLEKKMLDLKTANEELKSMEEMYRLSFEHVTDVIYTADADLHITGISPSVERLLGYKPQDFIGRSVADLGNILVPRFLEQAVSDMRSVLKGETILAATYQFIARDGTIKCGEVSGSPIIREGRIIGMISVARDVTERKKLEDALLTSEASFTMLVNTIPDIVVRTDLSGKIIFTNDYVTKVTGYTHEELEGRNLLDFIYPDEQAGAIQKMTAMLSEGRQGPSIYHLIMKDGRRVPFEVNGDVLLDQDGKPFGRVHICRDISLRMQAEREKEQLQEKLIQVQKIESIGRLAGGIAHDFNNMLGVILGHVELALERTQPSQTLHAHLQEIRKAAQRSADLTSQLLAFARRQTVSPMILNTNETITAMLKMLQRLIGEDINLAWLPGPNVWPVEIDPSQIDQILANLCVNARDAINGTGKVTIETGNIALDKTYCTDHPGFIPGEYVLLTVSDDGCGMSRETQSRLFEPFFTTKETGKGTGLGLATVYGIVKQNNGFINIYSEPGEGTTCRIYLPRHYGRGKSVRFEDKQETLLHGGETVLVVEDEPAILDLIHIILKGQGYSVLAAATPDEAISLASEYEGDIHLLLTDVVMPKMNGRDLAGILQSRHPHLKCLFTSGYTANVIAHHGILDDGVHFIAKPFSRKDLAFKVRAILDQP